MQHLTLCSDYQHVPPLRKDDNVLPAALDIPFMLSTIRNPRRRRISVGPQSEADARELLASREQRRQASRSRSRPKNKEQTRLPPTAENSLSPESDLPKESASMAEQNKTAISSASLRVNPSTPTLLTPPVSDTEIQSDSGKEDEKKDREMFSALEKPRIRYDVEVITKLIVYAGRLYSLRIPITFSC